MSASRTPAGRAPSPGTAALLAQLSTEHAVEVGALAALVLQDRAGAEEAVVAALVAASRNPRLPSEPAARRLHLLRLGWREARAVERRSGSVDPLIAGPLDAARSDTLQPAAVRAAMAALPIRQRALVTLQFALDLDADEVTAVMGEPARAVRAGTAQAVEQLRARLAAGDAPGTIEELEEG